MSAEFATRRRSPSSNSSPTAADYWGAHGPGEFEPGEGFLYGNPGYDVLGALLAEMHGRPIENLATERLLRPLAMDSTFAVTSTYDQLINEGRQDGKADILLKQLARRFGED